MAFMLFFSGSAYQEEVVHRRWGRFILPLATRACKIFSWTGGPLIKEGIGEEQIGREIIKAVEEKALAERAWGLRNIQLPFDRVATLPSLLREQGFAASDRATFHINLEQPQEQLWDNLKKAARKAVKKCQRQAVEVRCVESHADLERYYRLLLKTRQQMGFYINPFHVHEKRWEHLHKNGAMEIFMAEQDGELLAGLGILFFNGLMTEIGAAQAEKCRLEGIYAGDALKWAIIQWGQAQGMRSYDLAGVNPDIVGADEKQKNIYRFKEKWGGELVKYGNFGKHYSIGQRLQLLRKQ